MKGKEGGERREGWRQSVSLATHRQTIDKPERLIHRCPGNCHRLGTSGTDDSWHGAVLVLVLVHSSLPLSLLLPPRLPESCWVHTCGTKSRASILGGARREERVIGGTSRTKSKASLHINHRGGGMTNFEKVGQALFLCALKG